MDTVMIILGDTVPTESNFDEFSEGAIEDIISDDILNMLKEADLRFMNLEVPLCDKETPIPKCGPNLSAPSSTVKGIKRLNPSLVGLANNHTLDQGEEGLISTFEALNSNDINYTGAGIDLKSAQKPYVFNENGKKIGVYTCAEHEFTIADVNKAGANPFDPLESLDHIADLKKECDYLVVIYHGGKEHYRYPSPNLQKVCRKMADKGADLIVCQHSHCVGCKEEYKDSVIVYGQGNFLFDYIESEYWDTSLALKVRFGDRLSVEYIPLCRDGNGVRMANPKEAEKILQGFSNRTQEILREGFIQEYYEKYSLETAKQYFYFFASNNGEELSEEAIGRFEVGNYSRSMLLAMQNVLRCEVHNESFFTVLKKMSEEA